MIFNIHCEAEAEGQGRAVCLLYKIMWTFLFYCQGIVIEQTFCPVMLEPISQFSGWNLFRDRATIGLRDSVAMKIEVIFACIVWARYAWREWRSYSWTAWTVRDLVRLTTIQASASESHSPRTTHVNSPFATLRVSNNVNRTYFVDAVFCLHLFS